MYDFVCVRHSDYWTISLFFFNDTATTEIYTLSLHRRSSDLGRDPAHHPALRARGDRGQRRAIPPDRLRVLTTPGWCGTTTSRSEEHTSELQSRQYLVCRLLLEKKKNRPIALQPPQSCTDPM